MSSSSSSSRNRMNKDSSRDFIQCNFCGRTYATRSEFHKHCEEHYNITLSSRKRNLRYGSDETEGKKAITIDLIDSSESDETTSTDSDSDSDLSSDKGEKTQPTQQSESQHKEKSNPPEITPIKRGRGRPRKYVDGSSKANINNNISKTSTWQKSQSSESQKSININAQKVRSKSERKASSSQNRILQNYQEHSSSSSSSTDSYLSKSPIQPLETKIKISKTNLPNLRKNPKKKRKSEDEDFLPTPRKATKTVSKGSKNKTTKSRSCGKKPKVHSEEELDDDEIAHYNTRKKFEKPVLTQSISNRTSDPPQVPSSSKTRPVSYPLPSSSKTPVPSLPASKTPGPNKSASVSNTHTVPGPPPSSLKTSVPSTCKGSSVPCTNSREEEDGPIPKGIASGHKFACPVPSCDRSFASKGSYINHLEIHEGMKPFVCPYCSYGYDSEIKLIEHVSIKHCDAASFVCDKCGMTYKVKRFLDAHKDKCLITRRP